MILNDFQSTILKNFDKQIYFSKVLIWEECPLRCKYCFVDKESENIISLETLYRYIDLLLFSPWNVKLLHLLWWEPLLHKNILKSWVLYARKVQKFLWKDLTISFCTSWLLFDEDILKFVLENDIKLAWSIDWPQHIHDDMRISKTWAWTYKNAIKHKHKVFWLVPDRNLWLAIVVSNKFEIANNLFESFKYLVEEEWFTSMQISSADGEPWSKASFRVFIKNYIKIHEYILENIEKWKKFIYLNTMNKEFRYWLLSTLRHEEWRCIWFYTDCWVNWDIVFDPFVHKDDMHSRNHVAWNVNSDTFINDVNEYIWCTYKQNSMNCINCHKKYFSKISINNHVLKYRDEVTLFFANKIKKLAETNKIYRDYIDEAKEQMYV